jgi:hypothetical protein
VLAGAVRDETVYSSWSNTCTDSSASGPELDLLQLDAVSITPAK